MMAVVTEGYFGETPYDNYDTSQVFRIHGYSSQPRVVALASSEARTQSYKYLTIPFETPVKFRVVKGHKTVGDVQDLETIVEQNTLPVLIQPSCDKLYRVKVLGNRGYDMRKIGDFGNLLVTKRFEERFMMIQCIITQSLHICDQVNLLALTPDITLAAITGFTKDIGTQEEFQAYMRKLDEISKEEMTKKDKKQMYDMKRGNPDWGICYLETVSLATGSGGEASEYAPLVPFDEVFPDMGPPPPIPPRIHREESESPTTGVGQEPADEAEVIYEEIDPDYILDDTDPKATFKQTSDAPTQVKAKTETKRSHKFAHLEESIKRRLENQTQVKIASKEKVITQTMREGTTGDKVASQEMLNNIDDARKGRMDIEADKESQSRYIRLKQLGQGSGYLRVTHDGMKVGTSKDSKISTEPMAHDTSTNIKLTSEKALTKQDVARMTIAELGECLKALKLDKHVKTFKEQMIDGAIIQDLTTDDFVREFKLTKLEAIRLAKFITSGHIPK